MNFQQFTSYFMFLLSTALMIAAAKHNDFEFLAIMAGIFAIFNKIK